MNFAGRILWPFVTVANLALLLAISTASPLPATAEEPTATATPAVNTPTPAQDVAPTPPVEGNALAINGTAWIDATPAPEGTVVQALADGVVCAEGVVAKGRPSLPPLSFEAAVALAEGKELCLEEGTTMSFTIGGKPAHQTLKLDAAALASASPIFIDLSAGEPFAAYSGPMSIQGKPITEYEFPDGSGRLPSPIIIDASIVDLSQELSWHKCGEVVVGQEGLSTATPTSYAYLVVPSTKQVPGCGAEGASVGFRIAGAVVAYDKWSAGFHQLALQTEGPIIRVPTTQGEAPAAGQAEVALPPAGLSNTQQEGDSLAFWWAAAAVSGAVSVIAAACLAASLVRSRRHSG
ncbi:MAG: hypothetical protein QME71_09660 [Dehalococcoidia bacterium]|nr:hypothetical protein [Dehalococcoidia bacterium]